MKLNLKLSSIIIGIIFVILNSCGENSQPAAIEEKPKDTVKVEDEIVLKIEELDSVFVSLTGVKAKFSLVEYNSTTNPSSTTNEYVSFYNFSMKFNMNLPFTKNSKIDTIVYENYNRDSEALNIIKNQSTKLFDIIVVDSKSPDVERYTSLSETKTMQLKNIKFNKIDSTSYSSEIIGKQLDGLINKIDYQYSHYYLPHNPSYTRTSKVVKFISITEISDSAKISIRLTKKTK